jgi:hypothetical protein
MEKYDIFKNTTKIHDVLNFLTIFSYLMLNLVTFDQKQQKFNFFEEKNFDQKIVILNHSENLKSAKIHLLLYFQPLKYITKLWD